MGIDLDDFRLVYGGQAGGTLSRSVDGTDLGVDASATLGAGVCLSGCNRFPLKGFVTGIRDIESLNLGVTYYGGLQNGAGVFGSKLAIGNYYVNGALRSGMTQVDGGFAPSVGIEGTVPLFAMAFSLVVGLPVVHPAIPGLNFGIDIDPSHPKDSASGHVALGFGF